jgi:formyltetrahydrofolate deformylase
LAAGTAALQMKNSAVLLISCPDRKGIVATISDFVFNHNGNILHADEHADEGSNLFLMRVEFDPTEFDIDLADFSRHFAPIADQFEMQWRLARSNYRPKMIILVSKYDHCLVDLLARYMQILSNEFVNRYPQRIINIHHSFLPAFVGAKPYHQAFTRGVKLIGATGHYVTEVLDDGPIIEQDVVRISHRDSLDDLLQKGRDLEKVVLSRAVRWHIDNRVLLYGNKTVVFD